MGGHFYVGAYTLSDHAHVFLRDLNANIMLLAKPIAILMKLTISKLLIFIILKGYTINRACRLQMTSQ